MVCGKCDFQVPWGHSCDGVLYFEDCSHTHKGGYKVSPWLGAILEMTSLAWKRRGVGVSWHPTLGHKSRVGWSRAVEEAQEVLRCLCCSRSPPGGGPGLRGRWPRAEEGREQARLVGGTVEDTEM